MSCPPRCHATNISLGEYMLPYMALKNAIRNAKKNAHVGKVEEKEEGDRMGPERDIAPDLDLKTEVEYLKEFGIFEPQPMATMCTYVRPVDAFYMKV